MADGSVYKVKTLLAKGKANTKTAKSDKANVGFLTYSLSLAPAHASGFNLCTSASHACIAGCLFTSGFARIHPRTILPARIAKARFLRLHPSEFRTRLQSELTAALRVASKHGKRLAVRLNVVSDVMWEREMPGIFESFQDVQFYDYTKHYKRMLRFLNGDLSPNYHLTFSWSGKNKRECIDVLSREGNVAVPFHVKYLGEKRRPLPQTFMGYPIVDGDITDLRFLDTPNGVVVGLRAKGKAKEDFQSGFVVSVKNGVAVES